jgi:hypothetical protein
MDSPSTFREPARAPATVIDPQRKMLQQRLILRIEPYVNQNVWGGTKLAHRKGLTEKGCSSFFAIMTK